MPIILLALLLCSCSPEPADFSYSEMDAAIDAGKTPSAPRP